MSAGGKFTFAIFPLYTDQFNVSFSGLAVAAAPAEPAGVLVDVAVLLSEHPVSATIVAASPITTLFFISIYPSYLYIP
ncbi:hypothetical protein D3C86_2029780 [compost metagenome]